MQNFTLKRLANPWVFHPNSPFKIFEVPWYVTSSFFILLPHNASNRTCCVSIIINFIINTMFLPIFKFCWFRSKNVYICVTVTCYMDFFLNIFPNIYIGKVVTLVRVVPPVLLSALPRTNASFHDSVSGLC